MVNTFDTSVITIKKYSPRRLNSPSFTSPRFIKSSWTSSSDGYSVFSDNDDRDDDNIQGLVLSTSCSGSLSDADIDDNSVDNRSLNSNVRDHGPIDVDTCRKASNKDKIKKKVEVNFFEYTSPTKNKASSSGRRSSFIKKELTSLKALSTKTRLSLSRGSSTDTDSSGSSQSDSGGCFA